MTPAKIINVFIIEGSFPYSFIYSLTKLLFVESLLQAGPSGRKDNGEHVSSETPGFTELIVEGERHSPCRNCTSQHREC